MATGEINFLDRRMITSYLPNEDIIDTMLYGFVTVTTNNSYNKSLYDAVGATFCYVFQFFYGSPSTTGARLQIAFPYVPTVDKWRGEIIETEPGAVGM